MGNLFGRPSSCPRLTLDQLGESQPSTTVQITGPISAIIIGINKYAASPKVNNLEGAVSDALAFKKYLQEKLEFQEAQIRLLCDAKATRKNIIQEFKNLVDHGNVHHGAPILIYYAGHGGIADSPKDWEGCDPKIQMLIPHDFRTTIDGKEIEGIPDRTIGALLSEAAERWGDNITVILDSCYSGSGARGDADSSLVARFIEIPDDHIVPSDLDREIWEPSDAAQREIRGAEIAPGFLYRDQSSYILLAACKGEEVAYERKGALGKEGNDQVNGVFTAALLNTLYEVGFQKISYANLFQRLPSLTSQNPQCLGVHINRVLFDGESQECVLYRVTTDGENYVLGAGAARGINVGDQFSVYNDPPPSQRPSPLGTLVVCEVRRFDSIMTPSHDTPQFVFDKNNEPVAFALLKKAEATRDLRLYIADTNLTSTFEELTKIQDKQPRGLRILPVEKENARLGIDLIEDKVVFDILDERVTKFNPLRISSSIQLNTRKLRPILDAAAHFYWHLDRTGENQHLQKKVRLEFTEVKQVKERYDKELQAVIEPIGENLNQNGVVELVVNDTVKRWHGIKLVNETAESLYVALFYFDNSELSITSLYQSPFAGQSKTDPPLRPNGSITLGYGARGGIPNVYTLDKGKDVDVGFLKLFLSTEYLDLSDIPQLSPFTSDQKRRMESAKKFIEPISLWETILVPVVIRRE